MGIFIYIASIFTACLLGSKEFDDSNSSFHYCQDVTTKKDRQIFYMKDWLIGVREKNVIKFFVLRGDADWKAVDMEFVIPGNVDETVFVGNMTIGVRDGKTVKFYSKRGAASWKYLSDMDFTIPQEVDEILSMDSMRIGVRSGRNIIPYRKVGAAEWKPLQGLKFSANQNIDEAIYLGAMTIGTRANNHLRFYRKLGQAEWRPLSDMNFGVGYPVNQLFYVENMTIGIANQDTIRFYWKQGQLPWRIKRVKNFIIKNESTANNSTLEDPPTKDYSSQQLYLNESPTGINAGYAWNLLGGKGENVKIIVIEDPVDIAHEDFKKPFWVSGEDIQSNGDEAGDHGTAAVGEMIAGHNGFGINGICPEAEYGISAVNDDLEYELAIADAIDTAAIYLNKGDIILIERFLWNPKGGRTPDSECNPTLYGTVPVEYDQRCFDAIRRATDKGIIVVECAGNGNVNLDDSLYENRFNRNYRDSRALLIAADEGGNKIPACWTNYGSRIDFFAWGKNIVTTGKGDLPRQPIDAHKKYTSMFDGTSGAAPIVAGAIACLQGIRKKAGHEPFTSEELRVYIKGSSNLGTGKQIGIMPDIKATIENMKKN